MTKWKGQKAEVTVTGTSDLTVGILQDVTLSVEQDVGKLRGAGSIKTQDKQISEMDVSVTASFGKFTKDAYESITNVTSSGITDSPDPNLFDVKLDTTGTDSNTLTLTASGTHFESVEVGGSFDEHILLDLDGEANDLLST